MKEYLSRRVDIRLINRFKIKRTEDGDKKITRLS